eukprot:jgi/Botrbrau1/2846/Bobra.0125s0051.1
MGPRRGAVIPLAGFLLGISLLAGRAEATAIGNSSTILAALLANRQCGAAPPGCLGKKLSVLGDSANPGCFWACINSAIACMACCPNGGTYFGPTITSPLGYCAAVSGTSIPPPPKHYSVAPCATTSKKCGGAPSTARSCNLQRCFPATIGDHQPRKPSLRDGKHHHQFVGLRKWNMLN